MNEIRHQEGPASERNLTKAQDEVKTQPARRKATIRGRALVVTLELVAGLLVGLAILAGAAVWRLSSGPVSLQFMTPLLEEAVNERVSNYRIAIEDTVLTWAGWERAVDILVTDLQIYSDTQAPVAVLPEASIALSLRALLNGDIAPTSVDAMAPAITLSRDKAGTLSFGLGDPGPNEAGDAPAGISFLDFFALFDPGTRSGELGFLNRVSVLGANVLIDDQLTDTRLIARNTDLILINDQIGTRGTVSSDLELPGGQTHVSGGLNYVNGADAFSLTMRFADLPPSFVARAIPELALVARLQGPMSGALGGRIGLDGVPQSAAFDLRAAVGRVAGNIGVGEDGKALNAQITLDDLKVNRMSAVFPEYQELVGLVVPVSGTVNLVGQTDGTIGSVEFALTGGRGSIFLPDLQRVPLDVERFSAQGSVTGEFETVRLDAAEILLDGPRIDVSGVATKIDGALATVFEASLESLPWQRVDRYWMPHFSPDTRNWVLGSISGGTITEASMRGGVRIGLGESGAVQVDELEGRIVLNDTNVNVLETMPDIRQVDAVGTFGADWFNVQVNRGVVDGITVTSGTVRLSDLDAEGQGEASIQIEGDLRETLRLLDREPFGFLRESGLSPEQFDGVVVADTELRFPLRADLTPADFASQVTARTSNTRFTGAFEDYDLTGGAFDVVSDPSSLTITGDALLREQPVNIAWRQQFAEVGDDAIDLTVSGTAGADGLAALGLPSTGLFQGTVDIRADVKRRQDEEILIEMVADLANAAFQIDVLQWEKQAGTDGAANVRITLDQDGTPHMKTFSLESGDLVAAGGADIDWKTQQLYRVDIDQLRYGENDISGSVVVTEEGVYKFDIVGARLDLSGLLNAKDTKQTNVPISLTGQVDVLTAGPDRRLDNVGLTLRYDGQDLQAFILDSIVEGGGSLEIRYQPDSFGYALTVKAQDAGRALRSFDWVDSVEGGTLLITGHRPTLDQPIHGEVLVDNFKLVEAPVMARILQLVSLGLPEMSEEGLPFKQLDARYCYYDGLLTIQRGRAFGSSILVTAEGSYDVNQDQAGFRGTVGPASALTNIIKEIPLVGQILGGDEGLFAATYTVRGNADEPEINVNESAIFVPGAPRKWLMASLEGVPHACGTFDEDRSYTVADPPE